MFNFLRNKRYYLLLLFIYLLYIFFVLSVTKSILSKYDGGVDYCYMTILISSLIGIPIGTYQIIMSIMNPLNTDIDKLAIRDIKLYNIFLSISTLLLILVLNVLVIRIKLPMLIGGGSKMTSQLMVEFIRNTLLITSIGIILESKKQIIASKISNLMPKILLAIILFMSLIFRKPLMIFSSPSSFNSSLAIDNPIIQMGVALLLLISMLFFVVRKNLILN